MPTRKKGIQQPKKNVPVRFSINDIILIKGEVTLPEGFNYRDTNSYEYKYAVTLNLLKEKKIISILIAYEFYSTSEKLLTLEVDNLYRIENYSDVVDNDKISNENFVAHLVEISTTHTRGIQSQVTKNTAISKYYIPYISEKEFLEGAEQISE